jgi:hypothetical protein
MAETAAPPPGETTPARFTSSYETRVVYQRLRKLAVGEVVPYRELSELIGEDVQTLGRGAVNSARRIVLRDNRIVTDAVTNVGIKRLSDGEAVAGAARTFSKVRRTAQRGIDRLTAVDFDALPGGDKVLHNASLSALAVVKLMGRSKSVERIAAAVNTADTGRLPIARTLELFRQK